MGQQSGEQFSEYRLIRLLGSGGFAEVWLGKHQINQSEAAIKILNVLFPTPEEQNKFLDEARHLKNLHHDHIIKLLDFGFQNDKPFLILEYASNNNLRQHHPRGSILPPNIIVKYVQQIASGLQYAHDNRIIHRDIKPENLLLNSKNSILVSDFGIALPGQTLPYPKTQDIMGTISYMAPEQLDGHPAFASDQYSLAVIVYEWLCGSLPFRGTPVEIRLQQHSDLASQRKKIAIVSPAVEQVLFKALSENVTDRFRRVQEFSDALEQAINDPQGSLNLPTQRNQPTPNNANPLTPIPSANPVNNPFAPNPVNNPFAPNPIPSNNNQPPVNNPFAPNSIPSNNNQPPVNNPFAPNPIPSSNNQPPTPNPFANLNIPTPTPAANATPISNAPINPTPSSNPPINPFGSTTGSYTPIPGLPPTNNPTPTPNAGNFNNTPPASNPPQNPGSNNTPQGPLVLPNIPTLNTPFSPGNSSPFAPNNPSPFTGAPDPYAKTASAQSAFANTPPPNTGGNPFANTPPPNMNPRQATQAQAYNPAKWYAPWFNSRFLQENKNRFFLYGGGTIDFIFAVAFGIAVNLNVITKANRALELGWYIWFFCLLGTLTLRVLCAASRKRPPALFLASCLGIYWFLGSWILGEVIRAIHLPEPVPPPIIALIILVISLILHINYVIRNKR